MPFPDSDHYRNGRFFSPGAKTHGFADLVQWMRTRKPGAWRPWIAETAATRPEARPADVNALRVTFVGHATTLLQTGGLNLLTDPMWSRRASPVQWTGPKRHRAPGIRFDDLPPIDAILLSHNHYDHLDMGTLRRLLKRDAPEIFCPLGVARQVRGIGFKAIHECDWWEARNFRGTELHCVPAQHFSARTPFDRDRTLWCGWMVERHGGNVYFAGDTGYGPQFGAIARRFPEIRLALLPIGAYKPEWFMGPVHMSPDQALEAHRVLGARESMAIHFGTFSLADDRETEPQDRMHALLEGTSERFWIPREGEWRDFR